MHKKKHKKYKTANKKNLHLMGGNWFLNYVTFVIVRRVLCISAQGALL